MASKTPRYLLAAFAIAAIALAGCSYRYYADALKPLGEAEQGESKSVTDDGSVIYTKDRLEVRVRPMTDEELNRQFAAATERGRNPYTHGQSTVFRTNDTPRRFTVFRISVKNYEYPKIYLNPKQVFITTANGRKYYALTFTQLNNYFRGFALGGTGGASSGSTEVSGDRRGNEREMWLNRTDLLKRTMFPDEATFSGQEKDGYVVFEPLAADVADVTVNIPGLVIRFDYKGEPIESIDVSARFNRDIGKVYPDGSRQAM
ncbi:MAG: hypothetical protein ABIL09_01575 [Gemmatimonadota bacterium]